MGADGGDDAGTGGRTGVGTDRDDVWLARAGRRVVVRHRVAGGGLADALGDLVGVTDVALVVRTRRGDVRVLRSDVVAGKVVPPRASRPLRRTSRCR